MKKSLMLLTIAVIVGGFWLTGCAKNELPVINSLTVSDTLVTQGSAATITCDATDSDVDDALTYTWSADAGDFAEGDDPGSVIWTAPDAAGAVVITCIVTDGNEESEDTATVTITVAENYSPKDIGYYWLYKDEVDLLAGTDTLVFEATVVDSETIDSDVYWYVERQFSFVTFPVTPKLDTLVQIVKGDSVWICDPDLEDDYLGLLLPLWVDKPWDTGDGGTGTVSETGDVNVPAGDFSNGMHVLLSGGQREGDFWFAPNVGMVRSTGIVTLGEFELNYVLELFEYDF